MSAPTGASAASASSPPWSSDSPSSRAEHSMPKDSTPRTLAALILTPGSSAPTSAQGTFMPAATLGAPQTMAKRFAVAGIDCAQVELVGIRMLVRPSSTSATTTPENGGATGSSASTSSPAMVSRCASSSLVSGGLTKVRSQLSENCIVT